MLIDIVLGCNNFNEGRGKVIYDLLKNDEYDLCVRFNASNNVKHTIYYNNTKIIIYQLPIGILTNSKNLISSDCLINIDKLKEELEYIKSLGINIKDKLMISKTCRIISTTDLKMSNKIVEDFSEIFIEMGFKLVDMRKFWIENSFNKILLEDACKVELNIDDYPNCILADAINIGIPLNSINIIYGITKSYDTYIEKIKNQSNDLDLDKIKKCGNEFEYDNEQIQYNYLNLDKLNDSLRINQCNICIMNKMDVLEDLKIFKLYHNNELLTFNTMNEMKEYIDKNTKVYFIYSSNPYII